jgi:hypothetical protein
MKSNRVFWFSYHAPLWEIKGPYRKGALDYSPFVHQVRDGAAFCELLTVLLTGGYNYGGLLLNLPRKAFPSPPPAAEKLPTFAAKDLIVLTTRPPLSDGPTSKARPIDRSDTPLEHIIFDAMKRCFFSYCSRSRVTLAPAITQSLSCLSAEERLWGDVLFHQKGGDFFHERWVKQHKLSKETQGHTAGYLCYMPCLPDNKAGLLAAFGLSGVSTLFWATEFREYYSTLLSEILKSDTARFVLARLDIPQLAARPTSLKGFHVSAKPPELLLNLKAPSNRQTEWVCC